VRSARITLCLLVGISLSARQSAGAGAQVVRVGPMLRFVAVPDYAFGIVGTHWGNRTLVTVTLHANKQVERATIATTRAGSFLVGVSSADLCRTTSVQVQNRAQYRRALVGPDKPCLVILEASPSLTVLRGRRVAPTAMELTHRRAEARQPFS
jgi:hypothetical protein